jgi:hypothetical protein
MSLRNRKILAGAAFAAIVAVSPVAYAGDDFHAVVICQTASFYANYDHASGPVGFKRTLYYGNKVGHVRGSHPLYNGWAAAIDYGPNDWGFLRYSCMGLWGSW